MHCCSGFQRISTQARRVRIKVRELNRVVFCYDFGRGNVVNSLSVIGLKPRQSRVSGNFTKGFNSGLKPW